MIRINDDYVIDTGDNMNYILKEDKHKLDKDGNPVYVTLGYYSRLESALLGAKSHMVHKSMGEGEKSLEEAIRAVVDISNEFISVFRKATKGDKA